MDSISQPLHKYKYTCNCCEYHTNNSFQYNKHILTLKHQNNEQDSKNRIQGEYKYTCTICKFHTNNTCHYNNHMVTSKHIKNEKDARSSKTETTYSCACGKTYKYDSGYYRHKKNCKYEPPTTIENQTIPETPLVSQTLPDQSPESEPNWCEIIQVLVNENKEIRNFMVTQHNTLVEQNKTLNEVVKNLKPANNSYNTTTNNNNQKYTINMFLHEKCKDAQNFSHFIEELKSKVDMLKIYENGYVDGISKLFIDGLSSMEITERPLHCTDERRNTFYVHDNDAWNKDEDLKDTKKAIFNISQENLKQCVEWSKNIPPNTDRQDHITQSVKLCKVAWSGDEKNVDKIIKNISKEIPLNKNVMNELE